ncbi:MAG: FAD-dependent oxidoreductase [Leifsonia sp.]
MTSLWIDRAPAVPVDGPDGPRRFDEIVVGAGITGLITALLLVRAGRRVAVLEAREVGAVATGNTTAKLSVLQGAHLQKVAARNTRDVTQAYVDANIAGREWVLGFAADHGVPVQRRRAVSYAAASTGMDTLLREYDCARGAGLPVTFAEDAGLPFATAGAVILDDQAQFDPMAMLAALAAEFRGLGGVIRTGVSVLGLRAVRPVTVRTTGGEFEAERVVLATGTPVLDRGLYFAKLRALRSFAAAFRLGGSDVLPRGMYLSVDGPTRSIRSAPDPDGDLLLVGGNGYEVGRHPSPAALAADLQDWTTTNWPSAERTHAWSAQDYETPHGVPFVGWLPRGRGRVYLATGYDKWGMTNAAQCGLTLAADLMGELPDWAATLRRRATLPAAIGAGIGMNAAVAKHYAVGYARALTHRLPDVAPEDGAGAVGRVGVVPTAVSTIDGRTCRLSAVCPHLGAVLAWNDAEASWDCPAHGSRFTASGDRLEGPAARGLRAR